MICRQRNIKIKHYKEKEEKDPTKIRTLIEAVGRIWPEKMVEKNELSHKKNGVERERERKFRKITFYLFCTYFLCLCGYVYIILP